MEARSIGRYETVSVGGENAPAFIPFALPPSHPPIEVSGSLKERVTAAEQALSRLDIAGELVPSLDWFINAFVRKEAVLSSQIEGTQATLMDLLDYESSRPADEPPENADVEEVCNYVDALTYARGQLADPAGLPLSMRLLNDIHRRLMHSARGKNKQPGEVRRSQNWIGGSGPSNAVLVPPPPHLLATLLSNFERPIHAPSELPNVVRAGLLHVQFETIHPYLDGNGRMGRLLVSLLLEQWGLLHQPLLYLSLFLKRHRQEY